MLFLERLLADDKVSIADTALIDCAMMSHGACLRSPSEFRQLMTEAGFSDVQVVRTQPNTEYDMIYARKRQHSDSKKVKK